MSKEAHGKDAARHVTKPTDLAGCHALIEQLVFTVQSQDNTIQQMHRDMAELGRRYAELIQRQFRRRSERYIDDPNQLRLDLGDTDEAADAAAGLAQAVDEVEQTVQAHARRRPDRKPRNETLPENLPRQEVEVEAPEEQKHCVKHGERTLIGYDQTEKLVYERPKLYVQVTRYPKYACPNHADCGVASPERPTGLVEGDRYAPSVAAEIITAKYGFHLPVYRQQDLFAGSGWTPGRSTLLNILTASAFAIRPLAEHIKEVVLESEVVGTDDTRVTMLLPSTIPKVDPDDPRSQRVHEVLSRAITAGHPSIRARMWAYRSVLVPLVAFDFTVSQHRDGPELVLADFRGTLLGDCYSGYDGIALSSNGRIRRAACNAHARRKVFDVKDVYPVESSVVLARFQQLYDLEDQARLMSPDERLRLRQRDAVPVWASLKEWLDSAAARAVLPKSKFAEALSYIRNQWDPLRTYLSDGRIPIDNNEVEQLMKQVALGRKNWLFIGSVAAGHRAADFFTLVTSAVRNDLDVWAYLRDVLERLLAGETDYAALRPDTWRREHPEAVRPYRLAERRDRADRKHYRRAARRRGRKSKK